MEFYRGINPLGFASWRKKLKQDAVGAYIWAWLYHAYVKFVMCMWDMWVVQWYYIFEGLFEMREVVGVGIILEVDW